VVFDETRRWGQREMTCIGTGVRKRLVFDVYAACLYVDREQGKRGLLEFLRSSAAAEAYVDGQLDTRKLLSNQRFFDWLIQADLPLTIDMTFVRDVTAEQIRQEVRRGFLRYMQPNAAMEQLLGVPADSDVKKWQHMTVMIMPGGRITLQLTGRTYPPVVDRELARAVLSIYFDREPMVREVTKLGLVRNVDRLLVSEP